MNPSLFFQEMTSVGVSISETLLNEILNKENPYRKKRGGMGLGIFCNISLQGVSRNLNLRINQESQYLFLKEGNFYYVYNNKLNITAKVLLSIAEWVDQKLASGIPIAHIFQQHTPRHLVSVIGNLRCPAFNEGNNCSFCKLDGNQESVASYSNEDYIEALSLILGTKETYVLTFTSGLFTESEFLNICSLLAKIKKEFNIPVALECQPLTYNEVKIISETKIDTVMVPLDCYSIPAQNKFLRAKKELLQKYYWETTPKLVENFGAGNVTSNIIVGLEDIMFTKKGIDEMLNNMIIPELLPIRPHENLWLGETNPNDMESLQIYLGNKIEKITQNMALSRVRSGCAACGGCSAGFTANMFIRK